MNITNVLARGPVYQPSKGMYVKNRFIIIAILVLSGSCSAGTLYTTTSTGNVDSAATFGGLGTPDCSGASGDTVKVVGGTTLTFDIPCKLSSTTVASGHGLWITGTSGHVGTVNFTAGNPVTVNGLDTSANDNLHIDQYGVLNMPTGSTYLRGCAGDNLCRDNINGTVNSSGTWSVPSSQVNWSTATGTVTVPATSICVPVDNVVHPNVIECPIFTTPYWISNAAGTGPASRGDSSLTAAKIHVTGCNGCTFTSEQTSWTQANGPGKYFIDYDKSLLFFYSTINYPASVSFDSFYTLSFTSGAIVLTATMSYNEGIFNGSIFKYCGTNNPTVGCLTFANKQSDAASGGTHRKMQLVNNTFQYAKEPIYLSGTVTGTAADPLLITGNTSNSYICNSPSTCGWISLAGVNTSYVKVDSNHVASGAGNSATLIGATSGYGYFTHTGWVVTNNVTDGVSIINTPGPQVVGFPDLDAHGNFVYQYAEQGNNSGGLNAVEGTAGHPANMTDSVFYQPYRPYLFAGYSNYRRNVIMSAKHHGIITTWGTGVNAGFVTDADLENNLELNGVTSISCFTLGYLSNLFVNNVTFANNTCLMSQAPTDATPTFASGTVMLTDAQDAGNVGSAPNTLSSNFRAFNNIGTQNYSQWGRFADNNGTTNAGGRYRLGISVADHNDSMSARSGGSDYCTGTSINGYPCTLNRLATFTMGGGEYNTGARNVTAVTLHDPTYASLSGGTLTWNYISPANVTLSWNGGTPVQLVNFQKAGLITGSQVTPFTAQVRGGRLRDDGQSWDFFGQSASDPGGDWLIITGGTGAGQIRRIVVTDTSSAAGGTGCHNSAPYNCIDVEPAWTTIPDSTSIYVTWKSEVTLPDGGPSTCTVQGVTGQPCWVRAAITPWSLATQDTSLLTPSTSQSDTGIGIVSNMLNVDPKFQKSPGVATTYTNCNLGTWNADTQGGANDDYAGFQAINAAPSLTMSSFLPYIRACYTPQISTATSNCNLGTAGYTIAYMGAVTPSTGTGCSAPGALAITTTSLPNGSIGTPYSQILLATNAAASPTWSVASGSLSPLALSSAGAITGTPTSAGILSFTASVTDGVNTTTQALSITIQPNIVPMLNRQAASWY